MRAAGTVARAYNAGRFTQKAYGAAQRYRTTHPTSHPNYGVRQGRSTYGTVSNGRLMPSTRTYHNSSGRPTTRAPITQYIIR